MGVSTCWAKILAYSFDLLLLGHLSTPYSFQEFATFFKVCEHMTNGPWTVRATLKALVQVTRSLSPDMLSGLGVVTTATTVELVVNVGSTVAWCPFSHGEGAFPNLGRGDLGCLVDWVGLAGGGATGRKRGLLSGVRVAPARGRDRARWALVELGEGRGHTHMGSVRA